jgi:large subunit ribosomal protein L2
MALKTFKPNTPGQRQLVIVDRSGLWKGKPVKTLTEGLTKSGGRNNHGRQTSYNRGGGHKRKYRVVDFKRTKWDVPATVQRIEYDPNRTAFIALIEYENGEQAYILAPQRLKAGDTVIAGARVLTSSRAMRCRWRHAGRHDHPQCGAEAGQGWSDGAFRGGVLPARRPRQGYAR